MRIIRLLTRYFPFKIKYFFINDQAFSSLEKILDQYKIVNEDLFTLAMELFERKYTKSIISAIWIIVRLTDHIPQKLWPRCKGVIEELIKKKKAKSNLGKSQQKSLIYSEEGIGVESKDLVEQG